MNKWTHKCMIEWINEWTNVWINQLINAWYNEWTDMDEKEKKECRKGNKCRLVIFMFAT